MSAIQAELTQYKTYKRSPYMEIVLSVPIEREREVKEALGYLKPGESVWCGIARITEEAAVTKRLPFEHAEEENADSAHP